MNEENDISDEDEHSSTDSHSREDEMSSDDEDRSKLHLRSKRRRNTSEMYPSSERRQKIVREKQLLMLKQKRLRISEQKQIDSENKRKEYSQEISSDEGVITTPNKKVKTIVIHISDDSEQEHSDHSQLAKRIESEDDEIHCYKSTRNECQRVCTIISDEEMPDEEREEAHLKQSGEKQASFDSIEPQDASNSIDKLVLDYDAETNEALVTVHPRLSEKLKPHQVDGVTFMWKKCFVSVEKLQKGPGGGCILAHCMGLGKTLQVITLVHTLLTHECTKVKSVLVLCPAGTILNWTSEFEQWLSGVDDEKIKIYNLTKLRKIDARLDALETWTESGGVMIIGYEMFRSLLNSKRTKKNNRKRMLRALLYPGCDLVVCDEAHVLKNDKTALTRTVMKIQTRRRILLTGTPLQNNLMEFYCMLRFAKPGLLGSKKNYQNEFGHTITQGQFLNSDPDDVSAMKQCAYILNKLSSSITQRRDHDVLKQYLPPKREFAVIVNLSDVQAKLYKRYLETQSMIASSYKRKNMKLLADYQKMRLIWTHPLAIKYEPGQRKKTSYRSSTSDEEQSDTSGTYSSESSESSMVTSSTSDEEQSDTSRTSSYSEDNGRRTRKKKCKKRRSRKKTPEKSTNVRRGMRILSSDDDDEPEKPRKYRRILPLSSDDEMNEQESAGYQRLGIEGDSLNDVCPSNDDEASTNDNDEVNSEEDDKPWWRDLISDEDFENCNNGPKVPLLFSLLEECKKMNEKMLVFSQSLASLNLIEYFLKKYAESAESLSQNSYSTESDDSVGEWVEGIDYFRLDGSTTKEKRREYCKVFNDPENERARLFLISTKAGGLGINLTAANRVVIFDTSWNPSSDIQSIYRIYRFGQTKPCYVYRFISQATMEEKIYERQITKLSIARRIIDEDQIDRHFTREEVGDLYAFNRVKPMADDLANNSVADNLMARLIEKFPDFIINVHEHDSFLVNNEEEKLTEEERRMADEFGRSRSEKADQGAKPVDLKEKIRSVLSQIHGNSSIGNFSESDVDKLQQKLIQLYEKELKQRLLERHAGVGSQNPFHKSIPTDEKDKRNGPGVSYHDRRRPIFGMSINKVPEKFRDPERLAIEQHALLHILRADPNQTSSSEGPPRIPKTWVLTCLEKDAVELEKIFRLEFADWWSLPAFSSVGSHLLLHFDICVRRDTLEERLGKYRIRMEVVNPDFETMQSLIETFHSGPAGKKNILSDGEDNDDDDDYYDDDDNGYTTKSDDEDFDSEEEWLRYEDQYDEYYDEDHMRKMTKSFIS